MAVTSDNGYVGRYETRRVVPPKGPDDTLSTDDIMSPDYWGELLRLGRFIIPLRELEVETHGVRDMLDDRDGTAMSRPNAFESGDVPKTRLPGMGITRRVHSVKRVAIPIDTGQWDPDRQYLPDGPIDFRGW